MDLLHFFVSVAFFFVGGGGVGGAKYDNHKTLLWPCKKMNVCYLAFMDKVAHPMFLFIHIWTC